MEREQQYERSDGEALQPVQDRLEESDRRESRLPGGGAGRRDVIGQTPVYPVSASQDAPGDAHIKPEPAWGQGERGAEGYADSGDSELIP